MKTEKRKNTIWLAVILWTLIIFSASLQSGDTSGALSGNITHMILNFLSGLGLRIPFDAFHFFIRKAAHFTEYAILGFLVCTAEKKAPLLKSDALCIVLWMVSVPLCDECIQLFVSGRSGALSDSLLDICGFLCASLIFILLNRGQPER